MKGIIVNEAEYSRHCARVANSPYFYQKPPSGNDSHEYRKKVVEFREKLSAEKELLVDAMSNTDSVNKFIGKAKEIYDKAHQALVDFEQDEVSRERIYSDSEPFSITVDADVLKHRKLSPEDSAVLAAAIVKATQAGDKKAAKRLAKLAENPDEFRRAMGE